jgi:esterase/lipase superfamily enzyme
MKVGFQRAQRLTFGTALIRVPEGHSLGVLERPGNLSILNLSFRRREDERRHFIMKGAKIVGQEEFANLLRDLNDSAVIFVHGFNTTFADALFRTSQIAWDAQLRMSSIALSWPSRGSPMAYDYDRESALTARPHFLQLLTLLRDGCGIRNIFVVAHSMGNQIVVDSLASAAQVLTGAPIAQLALAAPDIDRDVFIGTAGQLAKAASGITLYASSADRALRLSKLKAGHVPRAGDVDSVEGPLVVPGIDTIDVTAVGNDMFGLNHGTYSHSRSVIDDIGRLITTGIRPPHVRSPQIRGVPEGDITPEYWRYPR